MKVLGIGFLTDASACVLDDGKLVAALSEERLNRVKQWHGVPHQAIAAVLRIAGLSIDEIDVVATHGRSPLEPEAAAYADMEARIRGSALSDAERAMQLRVLHERREHERQVFGVRTPAYLDEIRALGRPVRVYGHHQAHAASAYFGSGWPRAAILTMDGWGEDGSAGIWRGEGATLVGEALTAPINSMGYFYGSVTSALGFLPERHEGKVLGLAAHCPRPRSLERIRSMVGYDVAARRFVGHMERGLYQPRFANALLRDYVKGFPREDVAAAVQQSLEEVVMECVSGLGIPDGRIALAGGVFANVKLNQRIREHPAVREVYVFPNMGDGGLSVGAAWLCHVEVNGSAPERMATAYLGPEYGDAEVAAALDGSGFAYRRHDHVQAEVARLLSTNEVVIRVNGRMEYGPRALCNRSILYPAAEPSVNLWLNERLNRSEFMPFAPVTLAEEAHRFYIGLDKGREAARYMTMTFDCTPAMLSESPAAVHVDRTARPQVVSAEDNPDAHAILSAYRSMTGRSSLINTSYNMHEEPIVCTPVDALRAFAASGLPFLAMGNFLVSGVQGPK